MCEPKLFSQPFAREQTWVTEKMPSIVYQTLFYYFFVTGSVENEIYFNEEVEYNLKVIALIDNTLHLSLPIDIL